MKIKQGISLIVLVITIIVMLILAGAIILTLNNSGIIDRASNAVEETNLATIKELTQMAWADAYASGERTAEGLKAAVDKALADNKVDTSKYVIKVTTKGVEVVSKLYKDPALNHSGVIPAGATYTTGRVWDEEEWMWIDTNATTYTEGDTFPETVSTGDLYKYGDYKYLYNGYFCDGEYDEIDENQNGWNVCAIDKNKTTYGEILESINNKPLVSVVYAFASCKSMTTAPTIPNSVTNMEYAFYYCEALTTAPAIPNSVTNMNTAFSNCKSLTIAPIIPSGVTTLSNTFEYCQALTVIPILPEGVIDIDYVFFGCKSLKTYPGSEEGDGELSNYIIPSTVESMHGAFLTCESLVVAPNLSKAVKVTSLGQTFEGCTSLTTAPDLSKLENLNNLTWTFWRNTNMKTYIGSKDEDGDFSNYIIPNTVESMNCTFRACSSITNAPVIHEKVTTLSQLFMDCTSLGGVVTIHANPTGTYYGCFYGTTKPITLTGNSTMLQEIAGTATNVTVQQ